jgi:hypothetical protein
MVQTTADGDAQTSTPGILELHQRWQVNAKRANHLNLEVGGRQESEQLAKDREEEKLLLGPEIVHDHRAGKTSKVHPHKNVIQGQGP